jgi:hypothetical protein
MGGDGFAGKCMRAPAAFGLMRAGVFAYNAAAHVRRAPFRKVAAE